MYQTSQASLNAPHEHVGVLIGWNLLGRCYDWPCLRLAVAFPSPMLSTLSTSSYFSSVFGRYSYLRRSPNSGEGIFTPFR